MPISMRTAEAVPILREACGRPFRELLAGHPADLTTNKGHAGQLLEKYIGLSLGNQLIDFEDGELKTNKTSPNGAPIETIAVTQIANSIDDMLSDPPADFEQSGVCKKLSNLVIVPVVKSGDCGSWYLLDVYHIDMRENERLRKQFQSDYEVICSGIRERVVNGDYIGTTNGKYLQIRTKDSKPYNPIYSQRFRRYVSSKNYAFYLQKSFVNDFLKDRI